MAASLNIAVVEDHDDLRALTVELLQAQGHRVAGMASAEALDRWLEGAAVVPTDLFIIDLNLPGEDGLSLARRLRLAWPQAGIVMVTARGRPDDRVQGYGHGADLYLPKPVSPDELLAAIAALSRRLTPAAAAAPSVTAVASAGTTPVAPSERASSTERTAMPEARRAEPASVPVDIVLDTTALCLVGAGSPVDLTPAEAALLEALARAPRRQLGLARIADVLGYELQQLNKASLEVRVVRLRRKLAAAGADAQAIKAVRGFGYQLCVPLSVR